MVAVFLVGCGGQLDEQSQKSQDGLAKSTFETYSKLAGAETGSLTIAVENETPDAALLKISMVDHPDAWKTFKIPAQKTTAIDLGAMQYELQLIDPDTGSSVSNELLVSSNESIVITSASSSPFNLFIPDLK